MAEITKGEWTALTQDVHELTNQFIGVQHQLKTLAEQTEQLKKFQEEALKELATFGLLKKALALFAVLIVGGVCTAIYKFGALEGQMKAVNKTADSKFSILNSKLEAVNKTAAMAPALAHAAEAHGRQVARLYEIILERLGPNFVANTEEVIDGRIIKTEGREISLAVWWRDRSKRADPVFGASVAGLLGAPLGQGPLLTASALMPVGQTVSVQTDNSTLILVDSELAKFADLKAGMWVRVLIATEAKPQRRGEKLLAAAVSARPVESVLPRRQRNPPAINPGKHD